jgi:hypothetical protein
VPDGGTIRTLLKTWPLLPAGSTAARSLLKILAGYGWFAGVWACSGYAG